MAFGFVSKSFRCAAIVMTFVVATSAVMSVPIPSAHADTLVSPAGLRLEQLVVSSDTARHAFTVEIADTQDLRARGLMFRTELAADAGMLFDFQQERPVAFWMRNTLVSLDMIFIEASGRILNIATDTVPLSETRVPSAGPVRFVLEVPAGTSQRLGFKPGDQVASPTIAASLSE